MDSRGSRKKTSHIAELKAAERARVLEYRQRQRISLSRRAPGYTRESSSQTVARQVRIVADAEQLLSAGQCPNCRVECTLPCAGCGFHIDVLPPTPYSPEVSYYRRPTYHPLDRHSA